MRSVLRALLGATMMIAEGAAAACGSDGNPCRIDGGAYHAVTPAGAPRGAMIFLHGYGGSGRGVLRMRSVVDAFASRGYVVIAPDGSPMRAPGRLRWAFRPGPAGARDDFAFLRAVKADAARRFGFDADRVLLAGFSNGAFMTSYVACSAPELFAAYAPVGGTFWRPQPERCAGPVKLLQTHGWADATVPVEGRMVRGSDARDPAAFVQGDVFAALEVWRVANGCVKHDPDRVEVGARFWRRAWEDCARGSALQLALHPGGHSVPPGWAEMAQDWFEAQVLSN